MSDRPRGKTIPAKRLTRAEKAAGDEIDGEAELPHGREDCRGGPRPCPMIRCSMNLYLEVNPQSGSIKINFPDLEPWEMKESCALDVSERGGVTLEEVGAILNLTRERIRQVEARALKKLYVNRRLLGKLDE